MRTNIDIDDALMADIMAKGRFKTKREAVEAGLRMLLRQEAARKLLELEGKVDWGWGDEPQLSREPNWTQQAPPPAAPAGRAPAPTAAARKAAK